MAQWSWHIKLTITLSLPCLKTVHYSLQCAVLQPKYRRPSVIPHTAEFQIHWHPGCPPVNCTMSCPYPPSSPKSYPKGQELLFLLHFSKGDQPHLRFWLYSPKAFRRSYSWVCTQRNSSASKNHNLFVGWMHVLIYLCFSIYSWDSSSDWGKWWCGVWGFTAGLFRV